MVMVRVIHPCDASPACVCPLYVFMCVYLCVNESVRGCRMSLHLSRCVCVVLHLEKKKNPHLLLSRARRRSRPGRATCPFFTRLRHITSFPPVRTPPLPAGLTAPTSRPNPQNSLPSASIPPSSSLSAPFLLPQSVWGRQLMDGPQERVAGRVSSALWNFSEVQHRDGER